MIRQLRLSEVYFDPTPPAGYRARDVFAFGTHPGAMASEVHAVTTAQVSGNVLRIVMDELIAGRTLEEIQCRDVVDEDRYAAVPAGATPDDIARCARANDALPQACKGSSPTSVCLCRIEGGCARAGTAEVVALGSPVGVQDINRDGAADDTRMVADAVALQCGDAVIATELDMSYWNPSGDQNVPALGGFDALGPKLVVVADGPLPTGQTCGVVFGPGVVDKQGIAPCAPPDGDIAAGCEPGDTSAFAFGVEPLRVAPVNFIDGQTAFSRTNPVKLLANAPLDPATVAAIQISPAPTGAVAISVSMEAGIDIVVAGGFDALTTYTISLPVALRDTFGEPLRQVVAFTFTTGA